MTTVKEEIDNINMLPRLIDIIDDTCIKEENDDGSEVCINQGAYGCSDSASLDLSSVSHLYTDNYIHYNGPQAGSPYVRAPPPSTSKIIEQDSSSRGRKYITGREFSCPEPGCLYSSDSRGNLKKHIRIHTGEKPYSCPGCTARFADPGGCKRHVQIYLNTGHCPRRRVCKVNNVGVGTIHNTNVILDSSIDHDDVSVSIENEEGRNNVDENHNESNVITYTCSDSTCTFTTNNKIKYIKHLRTHSGEKPYACDQCGKRFSDCSSRNRHRKVYVNTGVCPRLKRTAEEIELSKLEESMNPKKIEQKSVKKRKIESGDIHDQGSTGVDYGSSTDDRKIVSGDTFMFECDEEGCSFTTPLKKILIDHFRLHTGEKPFSCDNCGACFSQKASRNRHIKTFRLSGSCPRYRSAVGTSATSAVDKTYSCKTPGCNFSCDSLSALENHISNDCDCMNAMLSNTTSPCNNHGASESIWDLLLKAAEIQKDVKD